MIVKKEHHYVRSRIHKNCEYDDNFIEKYGERNIEGIYYVFS